MLPATRKRSLWIAALGAVVLSGYLWHVWYFRAYINDDAYITFRYSLFLTLGRGPYYNLAEHVEGYTNFLLMLLMVGAIKLLGPSLVPLAAKLVGVLGGLTALLAAWALCTRWLRKIDAVAAHATLLAWTAPALVAVNAAYALNSVSGLETTLFSGLILLGLWLQQRALDEARWRGAGVVFALAALTRPEGLLVFGALALGQLPTGVWRTRAARRALIRDAAIMAGTVAAHLAFRLAFYDGEWLPNTYYAKAGDQLWHARAAGHLLDFARLHLGGLACATALLPLAARRAELRRACAPALMLGVLVVLALFKTGPDWMLGYRLLVPYAPIWAALSVAGVAALVDRVGRRVLPVTAVACGLFLLVVSRQSGVRRDYHDLIQASSQGYQVGHAALGDWLRSHAAAGDAIALMDIGIVGYKCPNLRILDISGLTDRHIARSPGSLFHKQYAPRYVLDQRPRYIVLVITQYSKKDGSVSYMALTPAEARLAQQPDFDTHYRRPPPAEPPDDPRAALATTLGAVRVFEHADPKSTYLLAVYAYGE